MIRVTRVNHLEYCCRSTDWSTLPLFKPDDNLITYIYWSTFFNHNHRFRINKVTSMGYKQSHGQNLIPAFLSSGNCLFNYLCLLNFFCHFLCLLNSLCLFNSLCYGLFLQAKIYNLKFKQCLGVFEITRPTGLQVADSWAGAVSLSNTCQWWRLQS